MTVLIILVIILLVLGLVGSLFSSSTRIEKISKEEIEMLTKSIFDKRPHFHFSEKVLLLESDQYLAFDAVAEELCVVSNIRCPDPIILSKRDIIECELQENDITISKTTLTSSTASSTGSMLARAAAGGLVLGGVGAVIGGVTGKKESHGQSSTTTETLESHAEVLITTRDYSRPVHRIDFHESKGIAMQWAGIITIMMNSAQDSSPKREIQYSNGNYIGEFSQDGKRHGRGKMAWDNGICYEGEFINDEQTGYGKMSWPDGTVKRGKFLNGVYVG